MPQPFELPEDLSTLSNEELSQALEAALAAFDAKKADSLKGFTTADLDELKSFAAAAEDIRAEQGNRAEAAEAALAEIEALEVQVHGTPEEPAAEVVETPAEEPVAEVVETPAEEPVAVAASAIQRRPALDLSIVRRAQPPLPVAAVPSITITASAEVPGVNLGTGLDMGGLTDAVTNVANLVNGGGKALAASYQLPFAKDLTINDAGSVEEGTTKLIAAADQRRLKGGDLVASGGWCAPSETLYEFTEFSCPDNLWDLPEVNLSRGGLRYYMTPELDINAMAWVWTEADDISAVDGDPTKPCFKIPCQDPVEVRCDVYGACVQSGILTQRFFPELTTFWIRRAMVAYEFRLKAAMYAQARAKATAVTTAQSFASFTAVFGALALQVADMVERWHLCNTINLEVAMPWWLRNMFLADIARRSGTQVCDLPSNCIENAFAEIGVRVNWVKGLPPTVPTEIGGTTPATDWPSQVEVLLYPAGAFAMGRGPEINLGVIHDSTLLKTNDMTALFFESCNALIYRGPEARAITVPICADGSVGPRATVACPTA
ncbi:hypothetical protein SUDANB1_05664 [Streptomyces sp. enrichment culture]|uniref:major capsid protein n=1 Tax=Streptomyces sp. enrichment culture TaxID=1795815 RepID=UPI003F54D0B4